MLPFQPPPCKNIVCPVEPMFSKHQSAILIHIGTQQLPKQLPMYIEKKYYHIRKKVPELSLHPDTLFQTYISFGTFVSCGKY